MPTVISNNFSSVKIRHKMGKAVIEYAGKASPLSSKANAIQIIPENAKMCWRKRRPVINVGRG